MCGSEKVLTASIWIVFFSLLSAAPAKAALLWIATLPVLIMKVQLVHCGCTISRVLGA